MKTQWRMVLGAASRRPLSAVSGNRSVAELPRALKFEKKGKRVAKAEGGEMPVGDNLAGKPGGEKKKTALAGTAGADAEPAPECECGEEAKLTSAKKASGETRFYWLCSKGETFTCRFMVNPSHGEHSRSNIPLLRSKLPAWFIVCAAAHHHRVFFPRNDKSVRGWFSRKMVPGSDCDSMFAQTRMPATFSCHVQQQQQQQQQSSKQQQRV